MTISKGALAILGVVTILLTLLAQAINPADSDWSALLGVMSGGYLIGNWMGGVGDE